VCSFFTLICRADPGAGKSKLGRLRSAPLRKGYALSLKSGTDSYFSETSSARAPARDAEEGVGRSRAVRGWGGGGMGRRGDGGGETD